MNYLVTALILILKEVSFFGLTDWIKLNIHKTRDYKKPYDCFFCLSVWANVITTILLITITGNIYYISEFGISILISKLIDLQWNKN